MLVLVRAAERYLSRRPPHLPSPHAAIAAVGGAGVCAREWVGQVSNDCCRGTANERQYWTCKSEKKRESAGMASTRATIERGPHQEGSELSLHTSESVRTLERDADLGRVERGRKSSMGKSPEQKAQTKGRYAYDCDTEQRNDMNSAHRVRFHHARLEHPSILRSGGRSSRVVTHGRNSSTVA